MASTSSDTSRLAARKAAKKRSGFGADSPPKVTAVKIDARAPPFSARLLAQPDKALSKDDLAGKTWILNVWASWCAPCLEEIPSLNALQAKYGPSGRLTVLGLSLDKGGPAAVKAQADKHKVAYPVAPVDPAVADAYKVNGFPCAFVIKGGKVLATLSGKRDLAAFERDLAPYLK